MCYQVMIVEDDPMVAAINKKYTETVPGFRVAGIFRNGAEGLEYLRENHVDLVILDYYMPEMNGDVFMDRIREEGIPLRAGAVPGCPGTLPQQQGAADRRRQRHGPE